MTVFLKRPLNTLPTGIFGWEGAGGRFDREDKTPAMHGGD